MTRGRKTSAWMLSCPKWTAWRCWRNACVSFLSRTDLLLSLRACDRLTCRHCLPVVGGLRYHFVPESSPAQTIQEYPCSVQNAATTSPPALPSAKTAARPFLGPLPSRQFPLPLYL